MRVCGDDIKLTEALVASLNYREVAQATRALWSSRGRQD